MNQQETRLQDAKLGSAVDNAWGFEIVLNLTRDGGKGDERNYINADGTIPERINSAIGRAIELNPDFEVSAVQAERKQDK